MKKMPMRYFYILLAVFSLITSAHASGDIYTVHDVKVDVKAESAVAAEQKAMAEARVKAFQMLVERLVPEDQRAGIDQADAEKIEQLVDGFEVNSQKNSKVRYMATMTFYFDGDAVQQYLGKRTASVVQTAKQPVVVVPVMIDQGGILLWGDQNPWLTAWSKRDKFSAVAPIVVPFGDLKDISIVDGRQVINGEISGLRELSRRYGGAGVIVAILRKDSGNPQSPMSYEAKLLGMDGGYRSLALPNASTTAGVSEKQFDQAIDAIVAQIENQARNDSSIVHASANGPLMAIIPIENPSHWMQVQQALNTCSEIQHVKVKGLSRKQATVELNFRGTTASLESALNARGLQLEQFNGQTWVIRTITSKTSTPS